MAELTRMRTRLPLRSTSSIESLFARDILATTMKGDWTERLNQELENARGRRTCWSFVIEDYG